MRQHEARRLAEQFHKDFTPTVQTDNLEVISNLTADTNTAKVLAAVATWHERRKNRRSRAISQALRAVSNTRPQAKNDNRPNWKAA
jgi:hypothetical protein